MIFMLNTIYKMPKNRHGYRDTGRHSVVDMKDGLLPLKNTCKKREKKEMKRVCVCVCERERGGGKERV